MFDELDKIIPSLRNDGFTINDPWDVVDAFEKKVANFAGSKFAVSLDSCTNALFLCLKYFQLCKNSDVSEITLPKKTYLSVPQSVIHAGYKVVFKDIEWQGSYSLSPLPIIDSATRFRKNMYVRDSYCCLSFHKKKILSIGKGGMILTDDEEAYHWFKIARYEGRHIDRFYEHDDVEMIGWNMYMPPEQAARGINLFDKLIDTYHKDEIPDVGGAWRYRELTSFKVFEKYR